MEPLPNRKNPVQTKAEDAHRLLFCRKCSCNFVPWRLLRFVVAKTKEETVLCSGMWWVSGQATEGLGLQRV